MIMRAHLGILPWYLQPDSPYHRTPSVQVGPAPHIYSMHSSRSELSLSDIRICLPSGPLQQARIPIIQ